MKCLLMLDEREVRRIHNLNELFNTLADAHKDKIRENFSYTPIDNEILLLVSKTTKFDFDLTFDNRLRYSADALQLFRYMHEVEAPIGNIIGWFAGPIKESARQTILEIRPEWKGAKIIQDE